MIDRKKFFDAIRPAPFNGSLTSTQVSGIEAILREWERRGLIDLRWLAYMLATSFWETARTMQPIAEIGRGAGHAYGKPVNGHVYYGRGYVQLTWDYNYKKMGGLLGVDLITDPDLALNPGVAAGILFEGMIRGTFTGKKLANYFNATLTDYVSARRIINGTDRAEMVAAYARQFFTALTNAQSTAPVASTPVNQPVPVPPAKPPASSNWLAALITAIASLFKPKG